MFSNREIDERFGSTRAIYLIVYVSRANYNKIPIKIYSAYIYIYIYIRIGGLPTSCVICSSIQRNAKCLNNERERNETKRKAWRRESMKSPRRNRTLPRNALCRANLPRMKRIKRARPPLFSIAFIINKRVKRAPPLLLSGVIVIVGCNGDHRGNYRWKTVTPFVSARPFHEYK